MTELEQKITEIFYDYHIRGCELTDQRTIQVCDKRKEQDIAKLVALFHDHQKQTILETRHKTHYNVKFVLKNWIHDKATESARAGVLGYDFIHRLEEKLEADCAELRSKLNLDKERG